MTNPTVTKKRIIRRKKNTPGNEPANNKPKRKKIIKRKKSHPISTSNFLDNTIDNGDEVTIFVKPWRCSSNNTDYLLDPITQEVFDKFSHGIIGFRYKSEDEISLIDYS